MDLSSTVSGTSSNANTVSPSPELFQLVFDSSPDGLIVVSKGTINLVNENVRGWTGFTNDELAGLNTETLLPGIDLVNPAGGSQRLELRRKQGAPLAVGVTLRKLAIAGGPVILCTLVKEDVPGMTTATLDESGALWQTLATNSPDLIMVTNEELIVEYTNRSTSGLIGKGIVGQSVLDSIPDNARAGARELLLWVLSSGEPRYLYTQHETKAFGVVFYETLVVRQKLRASANGLMLIARDTTRRERQSLELFESRQQLRSILNGMPVFIGVLSPEGIILDANHAALQAVGMPLADVIGTSMAGLSAFSYSDEIRKTLTDSIERSARGEIVRFDSVVRVIPHKYLSVHIEISPLRNLKGKVVKLIAAGVDITERRNIELALKENERRLQEAQHIAHLGYWQWDLLTGEFYWSPEAINIYGYDEDMGNPGIDLIVSLVHGEDRERVRKYFDTIGQQQSLPDIEYRVCRPDGSVRHVLTRTRSVQSKGGDTVNITGTLLDITDRKQIEHALRETSSRYEALVTNSPDFILTADTDYNIRFLNRGIEGLKTEQYFGHSLFEFAPPEFHQRIAGALEKCYQTHGIQMYETQGIVNDHCAWYQTRVVPILEDTTLTGYTLIATDITELKKNQLATYENEERLRQVVNVTRIGIFDHDHAGDSIYWSPELRDIYGWSADEEVTMEKYFAHTHPEDVSAAKDAVRRAHDPHGDGSFQITHRVHHRNGKVLWLRMTAKTKFADTGNGPAPSRTIGAVEDVTERKAAQLLLEKSENVLKETNAKLTRIEQFIDVTSDGIQVCDERGQLVYLNKVASQRLGIPQEHAANYNISAFNEVFRADGTWKEYVSKLKRQDYRHEEGVHTHQQTGNVFPVEVTVRHVMIEGKGYVISVSRDITERKNAEAALIKSEHTLRRAQQVAKIGSWILNPDGSLEWSEEVYHIFGLPVGKPMSYETFLSTVHPEDKYLLDKNWSAALTGKVPYDMIHRILVAGNIKWLREQAEISLSPDGRFAVAFGTVQDITTQRVLQEANLMFDQAQHFAGMGSWRLSIGSNEVFWSKSVFELLGYSADTVVSSENFMRVIHPEDRAMVESAFARSGKDKKPFEVEYRIRHDSGKVRWIAVKGNITNDRDGSPTEMYGILRDVTTEKTHKEELIRARRNAEEAASIKDEFLSVMSHEIRTPLNSVIGLSALLLKKTPREDQLPLLSTLKKSSDNLWSLINDVLDFNKIQTGNVELEALPFNVPALLRQIQSSYHPLALDKGLDLRVTIDPNIPRILSGDVVRLTQVLNNLVNNAIKFTSRGFIRLSVHLNNLSADSCTVTFNVSDSGIGMTKAQQQRLFVPFQQADKDITRKYGGTGLGLSIVKGLIKLMKGDISVSSTPQKGSTFSIQLTLHVPKDKKTRRPTRVADAEQDKPLSEYRILYVEDVEANQLVVQEVLHNLGAQCVLADSGKHALKLCLQQHFDVILMDLHMPQMDGYAATRKILHQTRGLNRETAVIAFTADAPSEKLRVKIAAAGIRSIVTKPFTEKQIVDKIKEVCPVSKAGDPARKPTLKMDFYENIFNHDRERVLKIKKVIESDFGRFNRAFLRFDKKGEVDRMREEIHKILPIVKNLRCEDLRALLEEYQKHEVYNDRVKALRQDFVAAMNAVHHSLTSYQG